MSEGGYASGLTGADSEDEVAPWQGLPAIVCGSSSQQSQGAYHTRACIMSCAAGCMAAHHCWLHAGHRKRPSLVAATKGVLRTTMEEVVHLAAEPLRAGRSALAGSSMRDGSPPPPSPRAVSRGIRQTLSLPLLVRALLLYTAD